MMRTHLRAGVRLREDAPGHHLKNIVGGSTQTGTRRKEGNGEIPEVCSLLTSFPHNDLPNSAQMTLQ